MIEEVGSPTVYAGELQALAQTGLAVTRDQYDRERYERLRASKRDTEFWTRLINARVSDWLGDATFLRIGTIHHSVVLMPSSRQGIQHTNHQVDDIAHYVDDAARQGEWLP